MKKYFYLIVCILFFIKTMTAQNEGNQLFNDTYLHEVRITFGDTMFYDTLTNIFEEHSIIYDGDGVIPYVSVDVEIDGTIINDVGIRFKGLSSYLVAETLKKPFKLDFNEYISGQTYDGLKKINLHNGAADPSLQREMLSYKMLREMGLSTPRTAYTKLFLNDEYWGVYILVEQIDDTFLKSNFADKEGNLFKNIKNTNLSWLGNDPSAYQEYFDLKTNETENDWSELINLVDVINNVPDSLFETAIEDILDIPSFLKTLAIDITINNWDAYVLNGRNFYLYYHPIEEKFHWIPWDYNIPWAGRFFHEGNPLPPDNLDCPLQTAFVWTQYADSVNFIDDTYPPAETWFWEFGDGTTSTESNPIHVFPDQTVYEVCLVTTRTHDGNICEIHRCETIDLSFIPSDCTAIIDSLSPYPAEDPFYVQTAALQNSCCNAWNSSCEVFYDNFESGGANLGLGTNLFLIQNNPTRILVYRLMSFPKFKNQYLEYSCYIQDKIFMEENIDTLIDANFELIKDEVEVEPHFLFTKDYFKYANGDGSGGGGGALIPPLRTYLKDKKIFFQQQLNFTGLTCDVDSSISIPFQSVVINELVASNNSQSGIADSEGEADDWIELYNNTSDTIWLEDYYFTNNKSYPKRWQFPSQTKILPNDFLILWADKDINQDGIHLPFKLPAIGTSLFLLHKNGAIIDSISYGQQFPNIAFARVPNGTGDFKNQSTTFLDNNENTTSNKNMNNGQNVNIWVAPNPVNNRFSIEGISNDEEYHFVLYNQIGQPVMSFLSEGNQIDISHLPSGVYILGGYIKGVTILKKVIKID